MHIPNFFGLFIKNLECFSLLFEVVAGLPDDTSTTKNWDQEETKATRFIYQILADQGALLAGGYPNGQYDKEQKVG